MQFDQISEKAFCRVVLDHPRTENDDSIDLENPTKGDLRVLSDAMCYTGSVNFLSYASKFFSDRVKNTFILTGNQVRMNPGTTSSWMTHAYGVFNLDEKLWLASSPANYNDSLNPTPNRVFQSKNLAELLDRIEYTHEGDWPSAEEIKEAISTNNTLFDISTRRLKTESRCWLTDKKFEVNPNLILPSDHFIAKVRAVMASEK